MVNFSIATGMVQKRVEFAMTSTVQILRGSISALDPTTLQVGGLTNTTTIYQGKAHIHNITGTGMQILGDAAIEMRTVQVSIPMSATMPHRDDIVKVLTDSDNDLPNRVLRVLDVSSGGLLNACHTMTCQSWFQDRAWT